MKGRDRFCSRSLFAHKFMKLAETLGRIGFLVGFLGPLVFYLAPFPLFQSRVLCPQCPYIDIAFATRLTWIQVALVIALLSGLTLALAGFGIGYTVSKLRRPLSENSA